MQRLILGLAVVLLGCHPIPANPNAQDATDHIKRAKAWADKGEYDKAITECDKALASNPKSAEAYNIRGEAWMNKSEYDKAVADWKQALAITPDDWEIRNNLGVCLWKQAQEQELQAAKAEAAGDMEAAKPYHQKSAVLKEDARTQWTHGITYTPTATDIHGSTPGYAYEANELDSAERHLAEAVRLKPTSAQPRNNLGRVLVRRSQLLEAEAREAEAKGKTDPAEAAKAKQLREDAKKKLDAAIEQFEKAGELDPTLFEARLNLGEIYFTLNSFDKSESQYQEILKLRSESVKNRETIENFSQACFGLARIAIARQKPDEAIRDLQKAIELNPQNVAAMQLLAFQRFQQGEYREGEKCLWPLLAMLPTPQRRAMAEQFGSQLQAAGKTKEAVLAWNFMAWAFATSPEPRILDPEAVMYYAQFVVGITKQQDPVSLDTLAAALAAGGHYNDAVQTAQAAIKLANSQGKKASGRRYRATFAVLRTGKTFPMRSRWQR